MKSPGIRRRLPFLLCAIFVLACHTSDDANAAAKQLAATSSELANYYSVMSQIAAATVSLGDLQNALLPHGNILPFSAETRELVVTTSAELQKRADVAKALEGLSSSFSSLAGSTAPSDVSDAASKLANELTTIKALPNLKGSPISLPSGIGDVGNLLVSAVQQHDEKKAAPAIEKVLSSLSDMFAAEKDAYDSLNETYLTKAASLAAYSIDQNFVDDTSVLEPALQPFSLTVRGSAAADNPQLKDAAKAQVASTKESLVVAHNNASVAMLQAIQEMGKRFHQLATEGIMPARGTPLTLTTVGNWITAMSPHLSSSTTSTSTAAATSSSTTPASSGKPKK